MKALLTYLAALALLVGSIGFAPATAQARVIHPTNLAVAPGHKAPALVARWLAASEPDSADLRQWAPAVRDQGQVGSCASNATTNDAAWYFNHGFGLSFQGGYAVMYQYAQITNDPNAGTTFPDNLNIEQQQGTEPAPDYSYGATAAMLDYTDLPTAADHQAAAPYRITGYHALFQTYPSGGGQAGVNAIRESLAAGQPVLIGFSVYEPFMFYRGQGAIPAGGEQFYGRHANLLVGYNADGSFISLNSWGTSWGRSGYAILSSSFVSQMVEEAWVIDGTVTPPNPVPTPRPVTPTTTPIPLYTVTPTPAHPTPTPRPAPHRHYRMPCVRSGQLGKCEQRRI